MKQNDAFEQTPSASMEALVASLTEPELCNSISRIVYEKDPEDREELEDEFMRQAIPWNLRALEGACRGSRYEPYRSLSACIATDLFAVTFGTTPETRCGLDSSLANIEYGLHEVSLTVVLECWQARQVADLLGIRYADYIDAVIAELNKQGEKFDAASLLSILRTERAVDIAIAYMDIQ
jgi:hypothetical protein